MPTEALLIENSTKTQQTAAGMQFIPGVFRARCGLILQTDPPGQPSIWVDVWGDCAVIGGPITFTVIPGDEPTWTNDLANDQKAWFLEYFDYSHEEYLDAPPEGFQKTQRAVCSVQEQPSSTEVTWSVPNVYSYFLELSPSSQFVDLHAEGPFQDGQVTAHFSIDYLAEDGNTYSFGCDDDTESTLLPSSGPTSTPKYMVSKVSGHKPGGLTKVHEVDSFPPYGPSDYYAGRVFNYRLTDTAGNVFPGVWIQERFTIPPGGLPPGFTVNTTQYWVTRLFGVSAAKPVGAFNEFDWIRYNWGSVVNPAWNPIQLTHNYWAATKSTVVGGINMGAYTFVITAGQPGTVVQNP